jgi:hypothetical protein
VSEDSPGASGRLPVVPSLCGEKAAKKDRQQRDVYRIRSEAVPDTGLAKDKDRSGFLRDSSASPTKFPEEFLSLR